METLQAYRYCDLGGRRHIRLLRVTAGENNETIRCTLNEVSLDDNPAYEALSYTWGDSGPSCPVICQEHFYLKITSNLYSALVRLRDTNQERDLWVDAVCINQEDLAERSSQVQIMPAIYKSARGVLIWLGEEADRSGIIFDYLETIGDDVIRSNLTEFAQYYHLDPSWSEQRSSWIDLHQVFPEHSESHEALLRFLARPWFRRAWIQQEASANPQTTVYCGSRSVTWNRVFCLAWAISRPARLGLPMIKLETTRKGYDNSQLHEIRVALILIRNIEFQKLTFPMASAAGILLTMLATCRDCGATDHRDRLYAFQHLPHRGGDYFKIRNWPPLPDYSLSTREVYTRFAASCLERSEISILAHAGSGFQRYSYLPSWVPDWTHAHSGISMCRNFSESWSSSLTRGSSRIAVVNEERILIVGGFIFDTLSEASGIVPMGTVKRGFQRRPEYWKARKEVEQRCLSMGSSYHNERYPTGQRPVEAFWQTLVGDRHYVDSTGAPADFSHISRMQELRLDVMRGAELLLGTEDLNRDDDNDYRSLVQDLITYHNTMMDRGTFLINQVCLTKKGYFGIVPNGAKEGDAICIILGCNMPLVLSARGSYWKLLGPCFINGIMQGEAIEMQKLNAGLENWVENLQQSPIWGPLPEEWEQHSSKEIIRFYIDPVSGRHCIRDPRREVRSDKASCPNAWITKVIGGDEYYANPQFQSSEKLDPLSDPWQTWQSDYGDFYINRETSVGTFDDPRFAEISERIPLPNGWLVREQVCPGTYFRRARTRQISWTDPRLSEEHYKRLPPGWELRFDFKNWRTCFRNLRDEVLTWDDPRSSNPMTGPLPSGWSGERSLFDDSIVFTNLETGERTSQDPCLHRGGHLPQFPGFLIV
jgi:hypothetical protein